MMFGSAIGPFVQQNPIVHGCGAPHNHAGPAISQDWQAIKIHYSACAPTSGNGGDGFLSAECWFTLLGMASIAGRIPLKPSRVRSFFETKGRSPAVSAQLYCNKLVYAIIRSACKMLEQGWLQSRWHWYRFPFSMRKAELWSPFLKAWFSPEDESAMECMMRLPDYEP